MEVIEAIVLLFVLNVISDKGRDSHGKEKNG
jgi:hypothetical protein